VALHCLDRVLQEAFIASVSVRVQKEDACLQPDLHVDVCMRLIANGDQEKIGRFGHFNRCKQVRLGLTETLPIPAISSYAVVISNSYSASVQCTWHQAMALQTHRGRDYRLDEQFKRAKSSVESELT